MHGEHGVEPRQCVHVAGKPSAQPDDIGEAPRRDLGPRFGEDGVYRSLCHESQSAA